MPRNSKNTETLFNKGIYDFKALCATRVAHCFAKGLTAPLTDLAVTADRMDRDGANIHGQENMLKKLGSLF